MSVKIFCIILCFMIPSLANRSFGHNSFNIKRERPKNIKGFTDLKITNTSGYRLPTNLKPTHYNLVLTPFLNNSTFKGSVSITFNVINATSHIVLNAGFDTIRADSLTVNLVAMNRTYKIDTTIDKEHEMVWFQLSEELEPQQDAEIYITYDGILASDMLGFYLSTYNTTDSAGAQTVHLMAITQFESTYARRAFPCFDEPAYRAAFTINIYRAANQNSMSNMKLSSSVNNTELDMVLDIYETSPLMPTYLVAFGVSDFVNKSDGGEVRVFTRASAIEDATFALSIAQSTLDSTGNFLDVPYPLEKMDVVAIPDFDAGAMENWGLTTYREKYVMYNSKKNTKSDLFGVLKVIAHEFAHQWFGDLVTPEWWDYTWLNEAFATYFEYTTPNQLFPEWRIGSTLYITKAVQSALASDIGDTRPMTYAVYTPDQINSIFDYVIYEKGGSVLRMTENLLTTAVWRDGLKRYLQANAYGTGNPSELFASLESAAYDAGSSITPRVTAILTTWTTQPGYPLVKLHKELDQTYLLTQSPYELSDPNIRWSIPLTYTTQEQAQFDATKADRLLLYTSAATVTINTTGWIILNVDQIGYFRVNYEDENWSLIINQLKRNHTAIGTVNRAQLIDDALNLAKTGHLNYSTAMALTEYLPHETGYAPWNAFITNMQFLINQFYNTSTGDGLMKYAQTIMASPFRALMTNLTTSPSTVLSSMTLLAAGKFSCGVHLPECENLATTAFKAWTQDPYSIPPETRATVICTQLRLDSSGKSLQAVLDFFLNSDNAAEQGALLSAMGCTTNATAINMYLNVICDVNANHVRLQDRPTAISALLSHQEALGPGLQYLINNYDKVKQALGKKIDSVFSTLGNTISQDVHIAQVTSLVNDTKVDEELREKLSTLVLPPVMERQTWSRSQQATDLKNWLKHNSSSSAAFMFTHPTVMLIFSLLVASRL